MNHLYKLVLVLALAGMLLPLRSTAQPGIDPPVLHPSINTTPAPGHLFFTPLGPGSFAEAADNQGNIIFSIRGRQPLINFQRHPNGLFSIYSPDSNGFLVLDSKFAYITTIRAQGYTADAHEFMILPNGHYLLMAYDTLREYDASQFAGQPATVSVIGVVIQEFDTHKDLVFEWRGFDDGNFVPEDMQYFDGALAGGLMDAVHANAMDVDSLGNIMLSSRHMSELTKIDRLTGHIVWRFGGKRNQFHFIGDTVGFSYQHSCRFVGGNRILLFDNGNLRTPQYSRAVEYQIDETAMTATPVWQFDHGKSIFGSAMGSVQRLPNGNTLIGWGAVNFPNPCVTEVDPSGKIVYEASLDPGILSYRFFRYDLTSIAAVEKWADCGFTTTPIFPNPATTTSSIGIHMSRPLPISVSLVDATGRVVRSILENSVRSGDIHCDLPLSELPSGVYHLVITSADGSVVQKVVH